MSVESSWSKFEKDKERVIKSLESKSFIFLRGKKRPVRMYNVLPTTTTSCVCEEKELEAPPSSWYLFTIPTNCLYRGFLINNRQNTQNTKNNDHMFNHLVYHTFPVPFNLTFIPVPSKFSGLYDSPWAVLGSTAYFFCATSQKIYYLNGKVDGTTFPFAVGFETAGYMTTERRAPKVVALDNKIYVFGHSKDVICQRNNSFCEVFEPHPDCLQGKVTPVSSPIPSSTDDVLFAVAMENEGKIIVGCNDQIVGKKVVTVFVFDVVKGSWLKHYSDLFLNFRRLRCQPTVVGSCLYWLGATKLSAYNLDTKQYLEGPIEDCFFQHSLNTTKVEDLTLSLFHLVGDYFLMTWVDRYDDRELHCATIHVRRITNNPQSNLLKLRASVVLCQTFASYLDSFIEGDALIL